MANSAVTFHEILRLQWELVDKPLLLQQIELHNKLANLLGWEPIRLKEDDADATTKP